MGLMHDLFGSGRKRKKKARRKSAWVADGSHQTKRAASNRAKSLRASGYKTRVFKLPNGNYSVFKK